MFYHDFRNYLAVLVPCISEGFNSLPPIINSLNKQKSLYKVLTPSIKPSI